MQHCYHPTIQTEKTKLLISIVAPLFNEEENVGLLVERIDAALAVAPFDYEIIVVDDGSTDDTLARAAALTRTNSRLRVLKLRRNYGQTPAMVAGIDHAKGEVVVTMDGDLQNDPEDIPMMVEKLDEGFDIVVGWRHNRQDKLLSRKIPSVLPLTGEEPACIVWKSREIIIRVVRVSVSDDSSSIQFPAGISSFAGSSTTIGTGVAPGASVREMIA